MENETIILDITLTKFFRYGEVVEYKIIKEMFIKYLV